MLFGVPQYNQGLYLSGSAHLSRAANDTSYLRHTAALVDAILTQLTDDSGLLVEQPPPSSPTYDNQRCVQGSDPGGDWFNFKGIMVTHLVYYVAIAGLVSACRLRPRALVAPVPQCLSSAYCADSTLRRRVPGPWKAWPAIGVWSSDARPVRRHEECKATHLLASPRTHYYYYYAVCVTLVCVAPCVTIV